MNTNFYKDMTFLAASSFHESGRLGGDIVSPVHLLLAMLRQNGSRGAVLVREIQPDVDAIVRELEQKGANHLIGVAPKPGEVPMDIQASRLIRLAILEARMMQSPEVDTEHLLLALLKEKDNVAGRVLEAHGVTFEQLARILNPDLLSREEDVDDEEADELSGVDASGETSGAAVPQAATNALDAFSTDLTQLARSGKMDPVIGREKEIERVEQILCRRKKNNPILIGEPGVGKSAIVEGLAMHIAMGKAPSILADRRIVMLDIASVVAGTKYRGQFEERLKSITTELKQHPEIIVFIDEIHTLVGAGGATGAMDAANLLKPALARGEIRCIGATTVDEFRKTIEKDGALDRRFQKVQVAETTAAETLEILRLLQPHDEMHHNVTYTDAAIEACVSLSDRFVSSRAFPDKALDAMDEAGARVHLSGGEVTEETVAEVISMMTGIPASRVGQKERARLLSLEGTLSSQVIGQDEAIHRVVRAIQCSRVGLKDPKKPIGTFLFVGPTGVGKTYLCKCLAKEMFGSEDALIRIDMSEYMEKHTVSRMVGAPPGYVGYDEGGQLTERVRRHPYSIVLLDEIEKAHPDVYNLLLQVMDEGRLTDGNGATIDFKNTVIIMTSNVGTRQLKDFGGGIGFASGKSKDMDKERAREIVNKAIRKQFAPEFINRLDDIVFFDQLDEEAIGRIVSLELQPLMRRIADLGYQLTVTPEAQQLLARKGYDVQYGARPLSRAIRTCLEEPLCEVMMSGGRKRKYKTSVDNDKIILQ